LLLLLFRHFDFVTWAARAAIAAEAATVTIATEATFAITSETAATIVALAVAIGLAHHGRGAFFKLFDANA
jgi:hypothetical protein